MNRANGAAIEEEHNSALVRVGRTEVDSVFAVILIGMACISGDVRYLLRDSRTDASVAAV